MFIITAKLSKEKIIIAALILAALICLICVLVSSAGGSSSSTQPAKTVISYKNISSNADRTELLESYGWKVSAEPIETIEVKIPSEGSEVFDKYNELQLSQGFDLTGYAGKNVKKYTYEVTNHPAGGKNVVISLLVYKKAVIGGDVTGLESPGFMHGLDFPTSSVTEISAPSGSSEVAEMTAESDEETIAQIAEDDAIAASKAVIPEPVEGSDAGAPADPVEDAAALDQAADIVYADEADSTLDTANLPVSVQSSDSVAASSIVPEAAVRN